MFIKRCHQTQRQVYGAVIRPTMGWPIKNLYVQQMKLQRWGYSNEHIQRDKIKNKHIQDKVRMTLIEDKIRQWSCDGMDMCREYAKKFQCRVWVDG